MHPILGNLRRLGLYLLAWFPIGGLIAYVLATSGGISTGEALALAIPLVLLFGFMWLSAWYSWLGTPLDHSSLTRLAATHLLAAGLMSGCWIFCVKALAHELSRLQIYPGLDARVSKDYPLLFGIAVLLYLLAVALHYVLLTLQDAQEAEARVLQAGILAREAELKALKAQVNPHFLFNSLNSISALTSSDPVKAREMCILLAEFLRMTLGLGDKASLPLAEELSLVHRFLAIEKVRFGSRLQ